MSVGISTTLKIFLSTILIFSATPSNQAVASEVSNLNVFASVESGFRFYDNQFGAYMSYQVVKLRNASNTDTIYGCDIRFSLLRADGSTYYSARSSYSNSIPPNSSRYKTLVNLTNDSNYGERWYSVRVDSISCTKESTARVNSAPFVLTIGDDVLSNDWITTSVFVSNPNATILHANSDVVTYSPSGSIVYSTTLNCSNTPYRLYEWPANVSATCTVGRNASTPFQRYEFLFSQYTLASDSPKNSAANPAVVPQVAVPAAPAAPAQPTMAIKQKTAGASLATQIGMTVEPKSKVKLTVAKASKKICKVSGGKLVALKPGNCSVTVSVTPAKTKKVKKPKTTKQSTVVVIS